MISDYKKKKKSFLLMTCYAFQVLYELPHFSDGVSFTAVQNREHKPHYKLLSDEDSFLQLMTSLCLKAAALEDNDVLERSST